MERDWELASYISSFIHNAHCVKRSKLKSPRQLNPIVLSKIREEQINGTASFTFDDFVKKNFAKS